MGRAPGRQEPPPPPSFRPTSPSFHPREPVHIPQARHPPTPQTIPSPRKESGAASPPSPQYRIRGPRVCSAHTWASIQHSPSPLKALRERGIKGERVPFPDPTAPYTPHPASSYAPSQTTPHPSTATPPPPQSPPADPSFPSASAKPSSAQARDWPRCPG